MRSEHFLFLLQLPALPPPPPPPCPPPRPRSPHSRHNHSHRSNEVIPSPRNRRRTALSGCFRETRVLGVRFMAEPPRSYLNNLNKASFPLLYYHPKLLLSLMRSCREISPFIWAFFMFIAARRGEAGSREITERG